MKVEVTNIGDVVDMREEDFEVFCIEKDMGYLSGLNNLLAQTYNEVQAIKDELVKKGMKAVQEGKVLDSESQIVLEGLYRNLMRIEAKFFQLKTIMESRAIKC